MSTQGEWLRIGTDHEAEKALLDWWRSLENARGDRAELRRCGAVMDVNLCEAFHRLRARMRPHGRHSAPRLAVAAAVLAHVREHDGAASVAAQMAARAEGSDRARVSGLRFKRLVAVEDPVMLLSPLTRVVRLLRGRANVTSLAEGILGWNQRTRTSWAYDYYDSAPRDEA